MNLRQQLLVLYSGNSSPTSKVVGFSLYDGSQLEEPFVPIDAPIPYPTVLDAMRDGWRVINYPALQARLNPMETDYLEFEFVLEKMVEVTPAEATR